MEALEAAIAAGAPCKQLAPLAASALPGQRSAAGADAKPSGRAAAAAASLCKLALKALDNALQLQQSGKSTDDEAQCAVSAAAHAVDALESCRACIVGSPDEPEAQRYSLLRRLVGLKLYESAFAQGCRLLAVLSDPQKGQAGAKKAKTADAVRLVAPGQQESQRTTLMAVGSTLNVVLCAVELGGDAVSRTVHLLEDIEPWARCVQRFGQPELIYVYQRSRMHASIAMKLRVQAKAEATMLFEGHAPRSHVHSAFVPARFNRLQDAASQAKTREQLLRVCRKVNEGKFFDDFRQHCPASVGAITPVVVDTVSDASYLDPQLQAALTLRPDPAKPAAAKVWAAYGCGALRFAPAELSVKARPVHARAPCRRCPPGHSLSPFRLAPPGCH